MFWVSIAFTAAATNNSICNQQPVTTVTWDQPTTQSKGPTEILTFDEEYELKWTLEDSSVGVNIAVQLKIPIDPLFAKTIAVIGQASSYKWTPTPQFKDLLTGNIVTLQNQRGYYFVLRDNNTRPGQNNCQGAISDTTSKEIQFITSGSGGAVSKRSSSSGLVWSSMLGIAMIFLIFE